MSKTDDEKLPLRPSITQSAKYLNVSDKTIRRYIAAGSVKAYRVGKCTIRVDRESLMALAKPMFV
jgi:excisionase family DNA binding protein